MIAATKLSTDQVTKTLYVYRTILVPLKVNKEILLPTLKERRKKQRSHRRNLALLQIPIFASSGHFSAFYGLMVPPANKKLSSADAVSERKKYYWP